MDGINFSRLRFRKFIALAAAAALACLSSPTAHAAATVFATATERFAPLAPVTAERALVYRVTFNTAVTGVDTSDFTATTTVGNGAGTVSSVLGTGAVRYVRVAVPSPGGEFRLDLKATGTGIVDASGNTLGAGFTSGQTYISVVTTVSAAWGRNDQGQLGLGGVTARTPTALDPACTFAQVSGGANQSLGVNSSGATYAWGFDNFATSYTTPVAVPTSGVLSGRTLIAVASGGQHNVVLSDTGLLFAWGRNEYGQLGDASLANSSTPVAVPATGALAGRTVMGIATGQSHTLALSSDGLVFSWGRNNYGQLGNNSTTASNIPVALSGSGALAGRQIVAISAGENYCLALSSDGLVFAWGLNEYGQLGDNSTTQRNVPVAVSTSGALAGKRIVAIAAGSGHSLALSSDGALFAWGDNFYGQLGNNSTESSLVPVPVLQSGALSGRQAIAIATGKSFNLVLTADRQVVTWGNNTFGQLGNGSTDYSQVPLLASASAFLGNRTPLALSQQSSGNHAFLIAGPTPATITGFALPASATYRPGQTLSLTVNFSRNVYINPAAPPRFELLIGTQTVLATYTGGDGTAALTFGYTILAGQGDTDGISLGRLLGTLLGSNAAPAYVSYTPPATAGILVDGIAPTATAIRRYSPAAGPTTARTLVYRVSFSEPVTGVDAADFTLRTGAFPYAISDTTGAIASVAGSDTEWYVTVTGVTGLGAVELKIKTSGTGIQDTYGNPLAASYPLSEWFGHRTQAVALSWGANGYGQLGNGTIGTATATNVPGLVDATGALAGRDIAAVTGIGTGFALDSTGQLYAWGNNSYGQFGNGTTTDSTLPVPAAVGGAATGRTFTACAVQLVFTLALASDGRVLAWGYNNDGILGDGSTTTSFLPVLVQGDLATRTAVALAAGRMHGLALTAEGRVYTWGNNARGQLGNGSTSNSTLPVLVQGALADLHIVAIAAGDYQSFALAADGRVFAWGRGTYGALGNDDTVDKLTPVPIAGGALAGQSARALAAGRNHSAALTADGRALAWGENPYGQLGDGTDTTRTLPTATSTAGVLNGKLIGALSCGASHSLALASGELFAWGANDVGQLGDGTNTDRHYPIKLPATGVLQRRTPIAIGRSYVSSFAVASDLTRCVSVALPAVGSYRAGAVLDFVLTFDHAVNVWNTAMPRLWLGASYYAEYVPGGTANTSQLLFRHTVAAGENLPAGVNLGNGLDLNGTTINDGSGWSIDLALPAGLDTSGIKIDTTAPSSVSAYRFNPTTATTAATYVVFRVDFGEPVVGVDGGDFTTSSNPAGATILSVTGNPSGRHRFVTVRFAPDSSTLGLAVKPSGTGITDLAGNPLGGTYPGETYERDTNTIPLAWGANNEGQLGCGSGSNAHVPVPINTYGALEAFPLVTLAAGGPLSLATATDDRLYTWSANPAFSSYDGLPTPLWTSLLAGKTFVATAAGLSHCLALTSDGRVYAAGDNSYGQLGNGTNTASETPVAVDATGAMAGEHIVAIAAGRYHCLALAASGRIYAWGINSAYQLGDGLPAADPAPHSNRPRLVATGAIPPGATCLAIAAGESFNLVLADNGRVYAWGSERLGTQAVATSRAPVAVDTSTGLGGDYVTAIAAGRQHAIVLTYLRRVYGWGANVLGQVGSGGLEVSLPTRLDQNGALAGRQIAAIAAGALHSLALDTSGRAYAWGSNSHGQLGDGATVASRSTPVAVSTAGALAGRTFRLLVSGSSAYHNLGIVDGGTFSRRDIWLGRYFSAPNSPSAADDADPDGDGRNNLLEYATRTNPLIPTSGSPVHLSIDPESIGLAIWAPIMPDPDLRFSIEASTTLAPGSWEELGFIHGNTTTYMLECYPEEGMGAFARRFFRLVVTRKPYQPK